MKFGKYRGQAEDDVNIGGNCRQGDAATSSRLLRRNVHEVSLPHGTAKRVNVHPFNIHPLLSFVHCLVVPVWHQVVLSLFLK